MSFVHAALFAVLASSLVTVQSQTIHASSSATCESLLQQEFDRPPDDSLNGFITDRVAVNVASIIEASRLTGGFSWGVSNEGLAAGTVRRSGEFLNLLT